MLRQLLDHLLPARCLLCRQTSQQGLALCEACHRHLAFNPTGCQQCARPLQTGNLICGQCQQHPPHYDHAIAPLLYQDGARQLILELKFQEKIRNARLLAKLFQAHLTANPQPLALVPVPLHMKRLRERGYNQSLELARELRHLTGIPVDHLSASRHRHTQRQADLPLNERRTNIRNAFAINPEHIGKHVAIIDDVMTSGYTVDELARALKQAGAKRVDVWVMARAG